jgi:hypothetical protein
MKSIRLNLSALIRPLRVVVAACVCAFLLFTAAAPAYSNTTSNIRSGETNLLDIERKSQEAVTENPSNLKETQKEANKGLNEIQGDSDIDKMKRPENSKGTSVEDKIEKALEKVTGK